MFSTETLYSLEVKIPTAFIFKPRLFEKEILRIAHNNFTKHSLHNITHIAPLHVPQTS